MSYFVAAFVFADYRAWRFIKDCLRLNQHGKASSKQLTAQLRSAQYEHWHRNEDLWICTGALLEDYMKGLKRNQSADEHSFVFMCSSLCLGILNAGCRSSLRTQLLITRNGAYKTKTKSQTACIALVCCIFRMCFVCLTVF